MTIARHEALPRQRLAAPLRLYLGVTALMALAAVAALDFGAARSQVEATGSQTSAEAEPPRFDGRGKWGGYAR